MENIRIEYKRELTDGLEKEVIAFLNHHDGGLSISALIRWEVFVVRRCVMLFSWCSRIVLKTMPVRDRMIFLPDKGEALLFAEQIQQ